MELSPQLLHDVEFGEQWRGYNQAEVDEFLERVAAALDSLIQRFQETTARAEAAERRLLERGDDDEIRRTLVLAQRTAASAVDEARAEAERIVAEAEAAAAERLAAAEQRLRSVENEVAERTRTEIEGLESRRAALAADVDALSVFVDEHRNRLAGELRRELAWLDRPELGVPDPPTLSAAPAPAPTPAPPAPTPEEAAAERALEEAEEEPGEVAVAGADDLTAAREELERALSGVVDAEQESPEAAGDEAADEPSPAPEAQPSPGRQIFDVLAEESEEPVGETTGVFDALDEPSADEPDAPDVQWRDDAPPPPAEVDDDPFLTELRKAITDDDPLGPRDHEPGLGDDDDDPEAEGSGWFRLRRPRG